MSEVKRYSFWPQIVHLPGGGGVRAEVHFKVEEDGLFVAYQDYTRLKAEVERLTAMANECEHLHKGIYSLSLNVVQLKDENERLRKAGISLYMEFEEFGQVSNSSIYALRDAAKRGKQP